MLDDVVGSPKAAPSAGARAALSVCPPGPPFLSPFSLGGAVSKYAPTPGLAPEKRVSWSGRGDALPLCITVKGVLPSSLEAHEALIYRGLSLE